MKKTFTINVAGFPFTIDDDAYTLLNDYLDTLEHAFARQDDTRELVSDIESRVAELLLECTASGSAIVTAKDVEEVIKRVGQPEDMIEEDESIQINGNSSSYSSFSSETITPPPFIPPFKKKNKKLFRDPQNAMVGGVCSGLAHYFGTDPTAVRLLTVLLTIVSISTMGIAYLILWLVVPEARTPLERMQMMGEQPTVENIGKTVTDNFKEENMQSQAPFTSSRNINFSDSLASFFGVCARLLVILGLVIAIPILFAMAVGLIGCIFALIAFSTSWGGTLFGDNYPSWMEEASTIPIWGVICGIGSLLALGIPLFLLIRMGLKKDRQPLSKNTKISLSVIWAIGFILGATSAGRIINLATEQDRQRNIRWNQERKERREKEQRLLDENQSQDENADWDDIADWGELAYPQSDDDSQTADSSTTSKAPTAATDSDPHKKSTKKSTKTAEKTTIGTPSTKKETPASKSKTTTNSPDSTSTKTPSSTK